MTFGAHAHTHKGVVPMATGASCPRRPKGGRGKTERGGGRGSLGELRRQAEVRVHTHTHRLLFSILQEDCLCVWLCVYVGVCVQMIEGELDASPQTILFSSRAILFDILSSKILSRTATMKTNNQTENMITTLKPPQQTSYSHIISPEVKDIFFR